jgi:hypothetical protein
MYFLLTEDFRIALRKEGKQERNRINKKINMKFRNKKKVSNLKMHSVYLFLS